MRKVFVLIFLAFAFLCGFFAGNSGAEVKEFWYVLSLEDTDAKSLEAAAQKVWHVFETSARTRGLVIKLNHKPSEQKTQTVMRLDTPLGELAHRGVSLFAVSGKNGRVEKVSLRRITKSDESNSTRRIQIGYANGRLGETLDYWESENSAESETLNSRGLLNLDLFAPIIVQQPEGHSVVVPVSAAEYFFPEIKDLRLRFNNLYPQNGEPFQFFEFAPGRLHFGSVFNTDVFISYWKDVSSERMVRGEISWEFEFGEFITGEEVGLAQSFFYFLQENLAKAGLIAPAKVF